MELTKNFLQKHLERLVDVGISKVALETDGSYSAINNEKTLALVAPAMEGYKSKNKAIIYGVEQLVNIIKNIDSPAGKINFDITKHSIVIKTDDITFTFRLTDEKAMSGLVSSDQIKSILSKTKFNTTYDIFSTVTRNTLTSLKIIGNEQVIFNKTETGFDMMFGSMQLHNSVIHVNGPVLPVDKMTIDGKKLQMILKSLNTEHTVYFSVDDEGKTLKIATSDDYEYYLAATVEV